MVCVMKRKNTDQLLKELMDSNDLSRVLSDNSACFREGDLPHGLQMLFDQQDMSKSALAKASGISEVYLHQVFSGRRTPSRDRLLCLCIGLGASAEETQSLLQQAHHAPLYARDKRDAVLLFGLSHSLTLPEINDALFTAGAAFRLGASAFSIAWHRPRDLRRWSSSRSGRRTQWTPCSAA